MTGNTPFFSVIMPVYNVEKYLSAAVDSILNQTFSDFELILVDDKSPDNCPQLCDAYAEKDDRVVVIHKEQNEGLGMARNTGMEKAKGEYLYFIDSDDSLEKNSFETIKESLESDTDILVFGVNRIFENKEGEATRTEKLSCGAFSANGTKECGNAFLKLTNAHIFPFAWNKVYKKDFIFANGALFEKTKLIEDFLFNIFVFSKARKIKVLENCFYNYRRPAHQTLVNTYSPEFYDLAKRKFKLESEFLEITDNTHFEARQTVLYSHIKHIVSVFLRNKAKSAKLSVKEQKKLIKNILSDETTVKALGEFVPQSMANKVVCFLLKKKMVNACYLLAVFVSLIKKG